MCESNFLFRHLTYFQAAGFPVDKKSIVSCDTVQEFDEKFTIIVGGWNSVREYYDCASSEPYLKNVSVPMLFINAEDDPLSPGFVAPLYYFESNENLILVQTPMGGHVGWCQIQSPRGFAFNDFLAGDYFSTLLQLQKI